MKEQMKCPNCGENSLDYRIWENALFYYCPDCPFVGFEYIDKESTDNLIKFLNKEEEHIPDEISKIIRECFSEDMYFIFEELCGCVGTRIVIERIKNKYYNSLNDNTNNEQKLKYLYKWATTHLEHLGGVENGELCNE